MKRDLESILDDLVRKTNLKLKTNLKWKKLQNGWRAKMEDNLKQRLAKNGKQSLLKDNLWWKITFDRRLFKIPIYHTFYLCEVILHGNVSGLLIQGLVLF